jgi:hypothetical protein
MSRHLGARPGVPRPERIQPTKQLDGLPDDVLRVVQEYLLPPRAAYCCVHDEAASMRCACKVLHRALSSTVPFEKKNTSLHADTADTVKTAKRTRKERAAGCVSVRALLRGRYNELCTRLSLRGHDYASSRLPHPEKVCAVHDCCGTCVSESERVESMNALVCIAEQALEERKSLCYAFSSWSHLAHFQELVRKAKINLSSSYRPVVTRVANGLRVSWIDMRTSKYFVSDVPVGAVDVERANSAKK